MVRFPVTLLLLLVAAIPVAGQNAPTSVAEIAADFDPRSESKWSPASKVNYSTFY